MKISTIKERKKSLEYLCELRCTTLLCINMVFKVSGKYNTKKHTLLKMTKIQKMEKLEK
jgi:hypothetical protein